MHIANYNAVPMSGISEQDYETLLCHLTEQVAARIPLYGAIEDQRADAASDALTNTWQPELTVREWLDAVGERLDIDTSACAGV